MNILDLISRDAGISFKKKASTLGGEYSGPCFSCGGDDRFSIHPNINHFVCRRCRIAGDSITFVMKFHNKKYKKACSYLGITPKHHDSILDTAKEKSGQNEIIWKPRIINFPSESWQTKATAFLFEAYKYLLSADGKLHRDWLNDRGISNNTIKKARMGWNTSSVSFDLTSWGLVSKNTKNEKKRQIWVPEGLIIPQFHNQKLVRLRIRRENLQNDRDNRFIVVIGSASGYFDYQAHVNNNQSSPSPPDPVNIQLRLKPVLITEAEIDGWLLHQKLSDIFDIYAIGNVSARPDQNLHDCLSNPDTAILLNLDNDDAGHNEQEWWHEQYSNCLTWYSQKMKDPGEDFQAGVDIRKWGLAGLAKLKEKIDRKQAQKSLSKRVEKKYLLQQNFKDVIYSNINSNIRSNKINVPVENDQNKQSEHAKITPEKTSGKVQKIPKKYSSICVHGRYCQHLKKNVCLLDKISIYHQEKTCPKEQWYIYRTGIISEIILAPGVKEYI